MNVIDYQAKTVEARDFEAAYTDYWNSTAEDDGDYSIAFRHP